MGNTGTKGYDLAYTFVPRNEGCRWFYGPVTHSCMQISVAHTGRPYPDQHLTDSDLWHGMFADIQRFAEFGNHGSFHRLGDRHWKISSSRKVMQASAWKMRFRT